MGKESPVFLGHDFYEGFFHLYRICLAGEAHPAGEPTDVGVDHNALSQIEGIPQNHIGRLSAHARELVQVLHGPGNLSAVILDQGGGTTTNRLGLGTKKTRGSY
jgi:hypothetical protein